VADTLDLDQLRARAAPGHLGRDFLGQQVRERAAQHQGLGRDRVVGRPQVVVLGVVEELEHHPGVVVRRYAARLEPPRRRLGKPPPLGVVESAERLVDRAEIGFELAHAVERGRAAGVGADALDRGVGDARPHVVQDEMADAALERAGGNHHADAAAHRGAEPAEMRDAEPVDQRVWS
jgi:hypothetical protein